MSTEINWTVSNNYRYLAVTECILISN
uniref:Uncharacterized protein n=1 Tax=Arundo donax TaxID=35708 RepID=A0A0A9TTU5_ARUDO